MLQKTPVPDLMTEQLRTFPQLAALLPSRCPGKKTHASTIARHALKGIRGVKLESIRIGGQRVSSIEALGRFIERLSATDDQQGDVGGIVSQPPAARRKAVERAEAELARAGF